MLFRKRLAVIFRCSILNRDKLEKRERDATAAATQQKNEVQEKKCRTEPPVSVISGPAKPSSKKHSGGQKKNKHKAHQHHFVSIVPFTLSVSSFLVSEYIASCQKHLQRSPDLIFIDSFYLEISVISRRINGPYFPHTDKLIVDFSNFQYLK